MKLKKGFILRDIGDEHMMIATGKAAKLFNGIVRNNGTANAILSLLKTETDEDAIVAEMASRYDAPAERIRSDVRAVLEQLRAEGFLDE